MRMTKLTLLCVGVLLVSACGPREDVGAQESDATVAMAGADAWSALGLPQDASGGNDISGPYDVVENWPENVCGEGYQGGSVGGVFAETPDRVFVFTRGCLPVLEDAGSPVPTRNTSGFDLSQANPERHPRWDHILVIFNSEGEMVESWEQHNELFVRPHRVKVSPYDPERHVWVVDDGAHSIYKFTPEGELVTTLGEFRVPGDDDAHFNRVTDIAWLPDGTYFISDGYRNTRVLKFNADDEFVMQWGEPGESGSETRPGYMNTVHGVAVDDQRRVYVSDRSNHRVQVFDENGNYLSEIPEHRPYYIYMSADQHLWVSDGDHSKIMKFSLDGKLLYSWGTFGSYPGAMWGPHQFSVDSEDNLYISDVHVGRVQKFTPKPGVNPALLVGQEIGWGSE